MKNKHNEHNVVKDTQSVTMLSLTIRVYCIRLAVVASQICEIPQNSQKNWNL